MVILLLLVILTVFTGIAVDSQTACLIVCAFLVGQVISLCIGETVKEKASRIYSVTFLGGWLFMLVCFLYMRHHGYHWLLAYDTYNYYIPTTESYISNGGDNLWRIYRDIFEDYSFFAGKECFFWVYTCTWGVIINMIGGSLYLGLQTATLFVYGFIGVVLVKLFREYGFDEEKSYKHSLVICLCSIVFFYSSQILRDVHVLLCYLIAIYLSGYNRFSITTLAELVVIVFITCEIRIESGLFLSLVIPTYLLLSIQNKKNRFLALSVSAVSLIVFFVWFWRSLGNVLNIFNTNADIYFEGIDEGSGVIAFFQKIPVVGDFLSIIYNASQPIPVWARLDPSNNLQYGGNASNILNFPKIYAAFFNVMTYVYIFLWLIHGTVRKKVQVTKAHKYQLWIGLVFLWIQSAVIEQRRLLGYYCVFYILMFLIKDSLTSTEKRSFNQVTVSVFVLLQLVGLVLFRTV